MNDATDGISSVLSGTARIGTGWGVATMLFGVLAIAAPFVTGVAVTAIVAVLLIASGVTQGAYAFKAGSFGRGLMQFLFGGITVLFGIAMLVWPLLGLASLTMLLVAYFLVDGCYTIAAGFQVKPTQGWGWIVFSGITSIVLAVLIWRQWPVSGAYAIGVLIGARLIFSGWAMMMLGAVGEAVSGEVRSAG
jgi:uncharacterized membrane protein HdeD (DUF308 family)